MALGSAAHALGYRCLSNDDDPKKYLDWTAIRIDNHGGYSFVAKPKADREAHKFDFLVDVEMVGAVGIYVQHCRGLINTMKGRGIYEEKCVPENNPLHKLVYGTPDCVIVSDDGKHVYVIDYKNGFRVVEIDENLQLLIYAILAVAKHGLRPERITMCIVQPNARHKSGSVRPWTIAAEELIGWAGVIRKAAETTQLDDAERNAGEHCLYCPAKVGCLQIEEHALAIAQADFRAGPMEPPAVPDDPAKLSWIMRNEDVVKQYLKDCRARASELANGGTKIPVHKLVMSKTDRCYIDKANAEVVFKKRLGKGNVVTEVFIPMGKLEKWIKKNLEGRKKDNALKLFEEHVHKPVGQPVLAPDSDPREEITNNVIEEFGGDRMVGLLG